MVIRMAEERYAYGREAPPMGATEALSEFERVKTGRAYVGRIVRVPWDTVHKLIGMASHTAYRMLAKKYKSIKVPFAEHKKLTGALMKAWCWELVEKQL